jgi:cellulose synthase/poly-beta-1,6-N-acetylglucosamine synthase-like glycosyltransferase
VVALATTSLVILVYTYVGYPLLIALMARLFPRARREDAEWRPTVTACVPVIDATHLEAKLATLFAQDYPAERLDVLIYFDGVDAPDGPGSAMRAVVDAHRALGLRVALLGGEARLGKPTALNRMRAAATGEVLLMTDARQALSPGAIRALVRALADPGIGCASGALELAGAAGAGAYWRYERWIRGAEARFRSMVGVTGALYAIRRADLGELPRDLILDDMWIPLVLRLHGRRIVLVEDARAYDEAFEDDREFGRKVRTLAGNYQLAAWLPRLLVPIANPSWFEYVSHKVMRLVCPFALIALLAATLVGASAANRDQGIVHHALAAVLGGQLVFYGLALLGSRLGKLGALARTFVVLNTAAVAGLVRFVRGGQRVTW